MQKLRFISSHPYSKEPQLLTLAPSVETVFQVKSDYTRI